MIEFEMKFPGSHALIKQVLEAHDAEHISSNYNYDTYYNHPCRDYAQTDEALRIRETNGATKITYKGPKLDLRSKTRKEIDIEVDSQEFPSFFEELGFAKVEVVRKDRETYKLGDYTITLDTVEDLGEFVEIEIIKEESSDVDATIHQLHEFVISLGLNPEDQILTSYLELVINASMKQRE